MPTTSPRRLRVVVLDHTAELGGAELALVRLLDAIPVDVAEVRVLLLADGPLVRLLRERGHVVEVMPLSRGVASISRDASGRDAIFRALRTGPILGRLVRRLRALRPDLVHTTSLKADLIGLAAANVARIPVVWHVHDRIEPDYMPPRTVALLRKLARSGPRAVIANSDATAASLPGVHDLSVVPPGLAPEQVIADLSQRRSPNPPVVGLLGRLSPTKGQLEMVRAAALVLQERPEVRFRLVGSPLFGQQAYATLVEEEIGRRGLADRVAVEGFAADPVQAIDTLSVLVHASPVPEPFGQVVIEGLARGVPVVATRAGGVTEILDPGGPCLGVLVEPGNVTDLAAGILAALNHESGAERTLLGWRSVQERYAMAQTADGVVGVWRRVAQRAAPR